MSEMHQLDLLEEYMEPKQEYYKNCNLSIPGISVYAQEEAVSLKDGATTEICNSQYDPNFYEDLNNPHYEYSVLDSDSPTRLIHSPLPSIPGCLPSPRPSSLETTSCHCNGSMRTGRRCQPNSYQLRFPAQSSTQIFYPHTYENGSSPKPPSKSSFCFHVTQPMILLMFVLSIVTIIMSSLALNKASFSNLQSAEYTDSSFHRLQLKFELLIEKMNLYEQIENSRREMENLSEPIKSLDFSNCLYQKKTDGKSSSHPQSITEWIPFSEDLNKVIVMGAYCSVIGGDYTSLEVRNHSVHNQYQCVCKGAIASTPVRYCRIHYWTCPRIINVL